MAVCWQQGSPLAVRGGKAAAANSHPSVHGTGYESAHTYKSAGSLHPPVRAMACTPVVFANPEFGQIRVIEIEDEPWLVGKDVAAVLGYSDTDKAIRTHVDNEDKLTRQFGGAGQNRCVTIINESGLYSLVLSSKLLGARKFRRWVTSEELPSIRKHGVVLLDRRRYQMKSYQSKRLAER